MPPNRQKTLNNLALAYPFKFYAILEGYEDVAFRLQLFSSKNNKLAEGHDSSRDWKGRSC